ncbi:MAG: hypothetical protein MAG715_00104 [Methanonatronarchaeales archaeon]|nr:hypothetical protein [Methanonatronarchaeales archaeon]
MTRVRGALTVDEGDASALQSALSPDDTGHIETRVEGNLLVIEFDYDAIPTALTSLDDVLSCLGAAMEVDEWI